MKGTDSFKTAIQTHLNKVAETDLVFAEKLNNPEKNIEDCTTYILNQVHKSGCNGFADSEIFGMAMHYYDEEQVEVGKPIHATVVVNHSVEITQEDQAAAKQKAMDDLIEEQKQKMLKKQSKSKKETVSETPSLFD